MKSKSESVSVKHNTWCTPSKVKFFAGFCVECGAKMKGRKS